ncbi:MAG: peptidylprolyl isomerase [Bacteroidia bacterium]
MKKNLFLALALIICFKFGYSQSDPVLLTVGDEKITKSEFEKVYHKNNNKENSNDPVAVKEYLELYINYKLKVKEAEEEKMDTSETFVNELSGYRKQLAQPYLTDKDVTDSLIMEAYNRMKKDVHAAHVLIKLTPDALPKDTLEAYTRIMIIRDYLTGKTIAPARITEYEAMVKKTVKDSAESKKKIESIKGLMKEKQDAGKDNFQKVSKLTSDDPSAKQNGGDLGFFTGLQMVYPFETIAYQTKAGEISMPVRTKYGYHLIKILETRPAVGEIHVAHVMVKLAENADDSTKQKAKQKIDELYAKLKGGEKFEDLATQFSDDKGSAKSGGVLPWFGTGKMVPEFEAAAFSLKNDGDYASPIQTSYGWHIIKRLEKKDIASFEDKKADLKNQVTRDSRSELSKTTMLNKIKKEYNFKEVSKNKEEVISLLDTSLTNGEWKASGAEKMTKPLITIGTITYTQKDFADYIGTHQAKRANTSPQAIGYSLYDSFVSDKLLGYEESKLDDKYPEFRSLMREYRDGILLFDLTDKKVWSKAVKDSTGLQDFYDKNKANYKWSERVSAVVYTCANKEIAEKVRKLLKDKSMTETKITDEINKDSQLNLTIKDGKFAKGDNEMVDTVKWVKGLSPDIAKNGQIIFVDIKEMLSPESKSLEESKGLVTADYQNHLEKNWIEQLRKKYPYKVNEQVLNTIGK